MAVVDLSAVAEFASFQSLKAAIENCENILCNFTSKVHAVLNLTRKHYPSKKDLDIRARIMYHSLVMHASWCQVQS